jgi:phenylpropionate dioxygenase-like ring-hydroxylating dioxygenase large terminal subunit
MLSKQDNDLLCQVGAGTPMGNLMRQYWIPALKSDELPSPDCPPQRLRLLGENLIAFRVTSGAVGFIANSCPHRGASLFFGRNEEEGLRCVYHGWKFDVDGNCVDMPSEPAESNFKSKVKATTYAAHERGGIIWVYMGPREVLPPLPDIEPNMLPEGEYSVTKALRECNYMQALEGDIDTSHLGFLHSGSQRPENARPGSFGYYTVKDRSPKYSVLETEFGTSYGAYRPAEDDTYYWRVAHFLFPFYTMIPTGILGMQVLVRAWVPIDDSNMMHWNISQPRSVQFGGGGGAAQANPGGARANDGATGGTANRGFGMAYLPDTSDWMGKFRLVQRRENDYQIDREAQRTNQSFTGIAGIHQQDQAVTESMGVIYERTNEHLGTSDAMVIRTRRRLINAAKAFRDEGLVPPGVDDPTVYRYRSGGVILPRSADWMEATKELRKAFVDHGPLTEAPYTPVPTP